MENQCTEFEYEDGTTSECLSAIDIAERGLRDCDTHMQIGGQTYCAGQEPQQAEVLGVPQGASTHDTGLMDQPVLSPGLLAAGAGLALMALGVMTRGKKEGKHGSH